MLVNCYDCKAGVSLLEEARSKDIKAHNAKGRFCPPAFSGFKENLSEELVMQESIMIQCYKKDVRTTVCHSFA